MEKLTELASLLKQRNYVDALITAIINRPSQAGHIGEFIAAKIFDIELNQSAAHAGIDGYFRSGNLAGKSVDVKLYGKQDGLHNFSPSFPDYYLIMTGDTTPASSSRGKTRPIAIEHVYLFNALTLVESLTRKNVKIGIATSVSKTYWQTAEIFPKQANTDLTLNEDQRRLLALFRIKS